MENASGNGLQRSIGLATAVALYVGAVIGAGVLVLPGEAAAIAGGGSLVAWLIDALLGIPIALVFAALAARHPDAGGVSVYVARAFGASWGAVVGWFYFVACAVGQAAVTLTGGYYLTHATGGGQAASYATAAVLLAFATLSNLRGIRMAGWLQMGISAAIALMLAVAALAALPHIHEAALLPGRGYDAGAIGRTAVLLFFAFFGWEAIAHLAEEFRDPARDVPRATLLAVVVITALYLGIAVAVLGTGTYGADEINNTAVARLLGASFGIGAGRAAALVALLISAGTANAFIAAASRLGYALARDGALPARLARLNARQVPASAIALTAVIAAAVLLVSFMYDIGAARILTVPSVLGITTYVLGLGAGIRLLSGYARWLAVVGIGPCLVLLPFAGWALLVPVAIAASALAWRHFPAAF